MLPLVLLVLADTEIGDTSPLAKEQIERSIVLWVWLGAQESGPISGNIGSQRAAGIFKLRFMPVLSGHSDSDAMPPFYWFKVETTAALTRIETGIRRPNLRLHSLYIYKWSVVCGVVCVSVHYTFLNHSPDCDKIS